MASVLKLDVCVVLCDLSCLRVYIGPRRKAISKSYAFWVDILFPRWEGGGGRRRLGAITSQNFGSKTPHLCKLGFVVPLWVWELGVIEKLNPVQNQCVNKPHRSVRTLFSLYFIACINIKK